MQQMQQERALNGPDDRDMLQPLNRMGLPQDGGIPTTQVLQVSKDSEGKAYKACLSCCGIINMFICCPFAACNAGPVRTVEQGFVGLKTTFGKYTEKVGPGLYTLNPCTDKFIMVDTRAQFMDLSNQTLLTKDNVTVYLDAYVHFKIVTPEYAIFKAQNYTQLVRFMTSGVMKTIVAEHTLAELLVNRKLIEKKITEIIDDKTDIYGIKVIDIETQKIQLPHQMERAMATVAESEKQSEARVIDAKGNLASAKIFKEAADELSKNRISLQLQYFETLKHIAAEKNSTIIVPDSIIGALEGRGRKDD
jgi:erythrocyte band 7 integral membrane protein